MTNSRDRMKKVLSSVSLVVALFLSLYLPSLPCLSHAFKAVRFSGMLQFSDGSPVDVGNIYMEEKIRAVPLFNDNGEDFSNLRARIDSDGSYSLTFNKPGRYELRLWGNPVSEFEVKDKESGLSVSGLSKTIRLPYDYTIQIRPRTRRIETVDSKTGNKRTKRVPIEFSYSPEIQVISPVDGGTAATFSAGESLMVPIPNQYAPPNAYVFSIVAEGYAPTFTTLREIPADKRGNMNYRIIKIAPRLPENKGVHNVSTKTYYWLGGVPKQKQPWLLSYSEQKRRGAAFPSV